jgi:nucleotide-binding universal stress UspA family protein
MSIFPTKILLATDGSSEAASAAQVAAELADKTASELHVVYVEVVPYFAKYSAGTTMGFDRLLYEKIEEEARETLRKLSWQVKVAGGAVAQEHLRMGAPGEEIVVLAEAIGAGLIVMGSRGRGGMKRALMDSVWCEPHFPDSTHSQLPAFTGHVAPRILPEANTRGWSVISSGCRPPL